MTVYNAKPKPRALFIGFDEEDLQSTGILELFPTYKCVDDVDDLRSIRQTEFEVAITYDEHHLSPVDPHLFVVSLGGEDLGQRIGERKKITELRLQYHESVATEFLIDETLDEQPRQLVNQTLLPIYQEEESHAVLNSMTLESTGVVGKHYMPVKAWSPLLLDGDGKVLCGHTLRSEELGTELWYLHPSLSRADLKRWIEFLLERWAYVNPTAFPNRRNWKTDPKWQSSEEIAVASTVAELKADFAAKTEVYQNGLAKLEKDMAQATKDAEINARVLLTTQGDTLKAAVMKTLEELGFTVTDVDEELKASRPSSDKLEDLRASVSLADRENDWISLVEVRGYSKGARLNDLLRLSRFTKRYMQESGGAPPDAVWYVVNHDIKDSPDNRQVALKESPSEVKEFGKDQGLVIDTVELFKLKRAVDDEIVTQEQARTSLISKMGTYKFKK